MGAAGHPFLSHCRWHSVPRPFPPCHTWAVQRRHTLCAEGSDVRPLGSAAAAGAHQQLAAVSLAKPPVSTIVMSAGGRGAEDERQEGEDGRLRKGTQNFEGYPRSVSARRVKGGCRKPKSGGSGAANSPWTCPPCEVQGRKRQRSAHWLGWALPTNSFTNRGRNMEMGNASALWGRLSQPVADSASALTCSLSAAIVLLWTMKGCMRPPLLDERVGCARTSGCLPWT
jgi:hypothetical protein